MKHMHRLMVTSNTYRAASTPDAADSTSDRDKKLDHLFHGSDSARTISIRALSDGLQTMPYRTMRVRKT